MTITSVETPGHAAPGYVAQDGQTHVETAGNVIDAFGDSVARTGAQHGNDVLVGGDDIDCLYGDQSTLNRNILAQQFDSNDYFDDGAGADLMESGQRDDTLFGGIGNDTMFGDGAQLNEAATFEGQDYLDGEDGSDKLSGGGDDDELFDEDGDDTMCREGAVVEVCSRPGMDVNIGVEDQSQCVLQAMLGRGQHRRPAQACNDAAFHLLRGAA